MVYMKLQRTKRTVIKTLYMTKNQNNAKCFIKVLFFEASIVISDDEIFNVQKYSFTYVYYLLIGFFKVLFSLVFDNFILFHFAIG